MKIEPTPIAAASLIATDADREIEPDEATPDATAFSEAMCYEELLPYLLLPMAGAY